MMPLCVCVCLSVCVCVCVCVCVGWAEPKGGFPVGNELFISA